MIKELECPIFICNIIPGSILKPQNPKIEYLLYSQTNKFYFFIISVQQDHHQETGYQDRRPALHCHLHQSCHTINHYNNTVLQFKSFYRLYNNNNVDQEPILQEEYPSKVKPGLWTCDHQTATVALLPGTVCPHCVTTVVWHFDRWCFTETSADMYGLNCHRR